VRDAATEAGAQMIDLLSKQASDAQSEGRVVRVVCISGLYYAACHAGLVKKGYRYDYQNAVDVRKRVLEVIADPATDAKNTVNLVRLDELLEVAFGEECLHTVELLFARDWNLGGAEQFRTTWTAGWWLDRVLEQSIESEGQL